MTPYYQDAAVTLYHGDCREILPQLKADAVICDPPYGCGVNYLSFDDSRDDYWPWMRSMVALMRASAPVVAFTHRNAALSELKGFDWVGVWDKIAAGGVRVGNSPLIAQWEPIFFYGIHTLGTQTNGYSDVFRVLPERAGNTNGQVGRAKWSVGSSAAHPCPKPVTLMGHLINAVGQLGTTMLDPFAGSGTTLEAARNLGKRAIGIEIEERYCEIAAKRLRQEVLPL